MKEKIKVLFTVEKKAEKKIRKGAPTLADLIEKEVPDMYEFIFGYGEEDTIRQVDKFRPEIIFLTRGKSMDALGLLKKVKQLHPPAVVFILLSMVDDEQETIDAYMAAGAYKCFFSQFDSGILIHDMYVALNLE